MSVLTSIQGRTTYLDTNIFIYFLEDYAPFAPSLAPLFHEIESGRQPSITSALTLAEVLVAPFRAKDAAAIKAYQEALKSRRGFTLVPVTEPILVESARVRAEYSSLRLPDAIYFATAALSGCSVFLTNDRRFSSGLGIEVVVLSNLLQST